MATSRKRWLVFTAGILANTCMGAGYAFSVFKKDLIEVLHCTTQEATLAYSLSFAFLPLGMIVGGLISRRIGPRIAVAMGGTIFGLGVLQAGFVKSVYCLYITYGLMVSLGNGIIYATVIAVAVRWFPERKGFASGAVVAALGVGTLGVANIGQLLVTQIGVQGALKALGICFLCIIVPASRFIIDPPNDAAPAVNGAADSGKDGRDVYWTQMLRQPAFWVLFALYICGASPGLLLISEAKEVAVNITGLGDVAAASMVGVLGGVASAAGRLGWATVSDKIGRLNTLTAILIITGLAMVTMPQIAQTNQGLWLGYLAVGLCYGGVLGTFPSLCADRFGTRNIEVNYALLFIAFSVAGLLGPWIGAQLKAVNDSYTSGFIFSAALAGVGLVLSMTLRLRRNNKVAG